MSLLLTTLLETLSNTSVIVGMCLAVLGISLAFLARRIACAIRKSQDIAKNDNIYITILTFGLIFILAGLLVTIIRY